mmetsp:Transcript_72624/g.194089  ORF Transcript_72624/g.194089 Transcript_72624/m.194089 type:complete len:561 (-) Transcript_72624:90-1772(-)
MLARRWTCAGTVEWACWDVWGCRLIERARLFGADTRRGWNEAAKDYLEYMLAGPFRDVPGSSCPVMVPGACLADLNIRTTPGGIAVGPESDMFQKSALVPGAGQGDAGVHPAQYSTRPTLPTPGGIADSQETGKHPPNSPAPSSIQSSTAALEHAKEASLARDRVLSGPQMDDPVRALIMAAKASRPVNESLRYLRTQPTDYYPGRLAEPTPQSEGGMVYVSMSLGLRWEPDMFGHPCPFLSLLTMVEALDAMWEPSSEGELGPFGGRAVRDRVVLNLGAGDGVGDGGNADPTYPLYKAGYGGLALEANPELLPALRKNLKEALDVEVAISSVTPHNIVETIRNARPRGKQVTQVDVLKVDIDGWDCPVIEAILDEFQPVIAEVELNVKFPPPLMMAMVYDPSFDTTRRAHVYGCSLSWMSSAVMIPRGYALVQVDWQNAIYMRKQYLPTLGLPRHGVPDDQAYWIGYGQRARVRETFWWNRDIEHLYTGGPEHVKTDGYRAALQFFADNKILCDTGRWTCQQGKALFGKHGSEVVQLDYSLLSGARSNQEYYQANAFLS